MQRPSGPPAFLDLQADALENLQSLKDWIRFATSQLTQHQVSFGQGCAEAYSEARWLVLGGLDLPMDAPDEVTHARLLYAERQHLWALIKDRVIHRTPTAYIVGEAWLCGYKFKSDPRAIIPRSYIAEFLTAEGFPDLPISDTPLRILELCTGSGCLAILAAIAWPQATIVATDLSPNALELAKENVLAYGLEERISLRQGDLFQALEHNPKHPTEAAFDLVLVNPPYVNRISMNQLPPEFQKEPVEALHGGDDGMDIVRKVLREYSVWTKPEGKIIVEIGHEFEACQRLFDNEFPLLEPLWLQTQQTSDRVFMLGATL